MGIANQSKKWQKVPFPISSQVPLTTQPPFQPPAILFRTGSAYMSQVNIPALRGIKPVETVTGRACFFRAFRPFVTDEKRV